MKVGEEGDYMHLSLHCHHQNDSCIKVMMMMIMMMKLMIALFSALEQAYCVRM